MKRFLVIMAALLLPVSANAQLYASFDDDAYDAPAASASASTDRSASTTETSADKARAVRRGEQTVMLESAPAAPGNGAKLTTANSRY